MAAVAVDGFADLAAELRSACTSATDPRQALADIGAAYAAYAEQRPALYDAMFTHAVDPPFASPEAVPAVTHSSTRPRWRGRPPPLDRRHSRLLKTRLTSDRRERGRGARTASRARRR
jgi:hypothetical protein